MIAKKKKAGKSKSKGAVKWSKAIKKAARKAAKPTPKRKPRSPGKASPAKAQAISKAVELTKIPKRDLIAVAQLDKSASTSKQAPPQVLCIRKDFNQHVALRYYKGDQYTECIVIGDGGCIETRRMRNVEFERDFKYENLVGVSDEFHAAEKLLAIALKAKEFSSGKAIEILREICSAKARSAPEFISSSGAKLTHAQCSKARVEKMRKGFVIVGERKKLLSTPYSDASHARGELDRMLEFAKNKPKKGELSKPVVDETKLRAAADRGKQVDASKGGPKKARGMGIGVFCCELIKAGKTTEQILKAVLKEKPGAKTTAASIAWYRNDLKQKGEIK